MRLYSALLGTLLAATIAAAPSFAADRLIPFQATLVDDSGTPLDGTFQVTFVIYTAAQDGVVEWVEDHANVSVVEGRLNVILGDLTSLDDPDGNGFPTDAVDFSMTKWLGISVNGGQEMLPRHQLVPAFHAARADAVSPNSIGATEIVDGSVGSPEIATGAVRGSELGFGTNFFGVGPLQGQSQTTPTRWRFCALTNMGVISSGTTTLSHICSVLRDEAGDLTHWTIETLGTGSPSCQMTCFGEEGE